MDGHSDCGLASEILQVWLAVGVVVVVEVETESTVTYGREMMIEFDRCHVLKER
jgi:hypothetical protein